MIQNKLSLNLSVSDNLKTIKGFGPYLTNKLCSKLGISPLIPLSSLNSRKRDAFFRLITEISKNPAPAGSYQQQ